MEHSIRGLLYFFLGLPLLASSQIHLSGKMVAADTEKPLAYVNIGIRNKNVGTVSNSKGSYELKLKHDYAEDTLTFSLVGYHDFAVSIGELRDGGMEVVRLKPKTVDLQVVEVFGKKLVERKFGVKRRNFLIHFTDGMFTQEDIFEIGQLIKLGEHPARIKDVNLYINAPREDSATFRINFYRYDGKRPAARIIEKSMIQRHAVQQGWLRLKLEEPVRLKGDCIVTVEFIPEEKKDVPNIAYEVKLGGTSKSFYRRNSQGTWNTPPHHYCLYVTALVDTEQPETDDDVESMPAFSLYSNTVKDSFSIFVQLPEEYGKKKHQRHPVIYHLDGNAYFDQIRDAVQHSKQNKDAVEPIVVGIGYANAYLMDSLRVRDYTFPPAPAEDSLLISGGGDKFYSFIKSILVPHVDRVYRTDSANRTIMGHSFGGYFVLYALLHDYLDEGNTTIFNNYVAASPSIAYGSNYLFNRLVTLDKNTFKNEKPLKLFLTMGERELAADGNHSFKLFSESLGRVNGIELKSKIYKDTEHMGTAIPSFEDGMDFFDFSMSGEK
ncbi:carboxypeptidase-like regulatory domain-containing protein [Olivibacter sp. SDN3]|uniref:alpha/beta hydrolase-fold protein n=1 Tax=Olivibacter sp. SDN3 TaxID=2764720 RepID=UPI001650FAFD|nr:alpha/beta hydrolase-fold protein [Olivibacter sp. SDN3]QNL48247.1 carboxypeptidase-like regulatory domain-containing protein [Olivibacter sp. SDN3]